MEKIKFQSEDGIIEFFVELNKYKANIYTDFTILSFQRPTTHNPLKSTPSPCTGSFKTALSLVLLPLNRSY